METVWHKGKTVETGIVKAERLRLEDLDVSSEDTELISEYLLYIYINDRLGSKVVCTPTNLPELITGRLLTEMGIRPDSIDSIHLLEQQNKAKVFVDPEEVEKLSSGEQDPVPTCCTDNATLLRANKGGAYLNTAYRQPRSGRSLQQLMTDSAQTQRSIKLHILRTHASSLKTAG